MDVTTSDGFTVKSDPRGGVKCLLDGEPYPAPGEHFEYIRLIESLAKEIERLRGGKPLLETLVLEYARDLRRNSSGGDNYPWEYAKATADYLETLVGRAGGDAQAPTNLVGIKAAMGGVTADPGDGCAVIPLEYVLIRGFSAMGWKLPATAAGDMLEAVAAAVAKEAIRHLSSVTSTEPAQAVPMPLVEPAALRSLRHLLGYMPDKDLHLRRFDAEQLLRFIDTLLALSSTNYASPPSLALEERIQWWEEQYRLQAIRIEELEAALTRPQPGGAVAAPQADAWEVFDYARRAILNAGGDTKQSEIAGVHAAIVAAHDSYGGAVAGTDRGGPNGS